MTASSDNQSQSKLQWQAESSHPEIIYPFREGLREVIDPEIGLNIIELGLVRDLEIKNDQAEVTMILTTPFCPYAPAMMEMTRKKAEDVLKLPVVVNMGMEMWEPSMMEEGAGAEWGLF